MASKEANPSRMGSWYPDQVLAAPPNGSPPSSYAAYAVVHGEPEAWQRFAGLTALRTAVILPGIVLAGVPPGQRFKAAAYASVSISAFTLLIAVLDSRR